MKPIEKLENEKVIEINDITFNHIIVGISKYNEPLILSKGYHEENSKLSFMIINTNINGFITNGNGYQFSNDDNSPSKMVRRALHSGCKVEVFKREDWKQALQWLIDNCE